MKLAGIDPSTYTAVAIIDPDTGQVTPTLLTYPREKGVHRAQLIAQAVGGLLQERRVQGVAIEGFAYNNRHTLITLCEISTLIKQEMLLQGIPWWEVPPNVLKKWTTGKGNATKEEMAFSVRARWGYSPLEKKGDDLVDAFALSKLAIPLFSGGTERKTCTFVPATLPTPKQTC